MRSQLLTFLGIIEKISFDEIASFMNERKWAFLAALVFHHTGALGITPPHWLCIIMEKIVLCKRENCWSLGISAKIIESMSAASGSL